ncbi:lysozyme inhibitor LprI family protein [Undibacterium sp. Ji49W]|uniref:lysozyme inhibitor LprI family protein n=1 Tax=Undibacterium sp. Ji49W TaxID=3413040 RepID=UPI003BEFE5EE
MSNMKPVQLLVLGILCAIAHDGHAEALCAAAQNTLEDSLCMADEVARADKKLDTYLQAAKTRLKKDGDSKLNLDIAHSAWTQYRTKHCGDVYTYWEQGSIRYRQSAQCQLDLIQSRTHDIWKAYLTYADTTPPVLPEP